MSGRAGARIRVLHLIKSLDRGGAEVLLADGLRGRDGDRFEYGYAYFLPHKAALVSELEEGGAAVVKCFGARNSAELFVRLPSVHAFVRAWRPALIHCHLPLAGVIGRVAGRLAGIPVVYTEHNVASCYHPLTRAMNSLTWRLVDRAVAVSGVVGESIKESVGDVRPVDVVRNGVCCESFAPGNRGTLIRRQLGIEPTAPVIGTVAVFREQKRLDVWLEMAKTVRARHPRLRCIVVGDGALRPELERCAARHGVAEVTDFVGIQSDVRPYLDAMDVYVMSSAFEGLPVALLEAMAMALPVVSTAVGGIPEVIRDGDSGLLVPGPDADELAAAVIGLLDQPERRAHIAAAARQTIQAHHSIHTMTRQLEAIYTNLLRSRGAAA